VGSGVGMTKCLPGELLVDSFFKCCITLLIRGSFWQPKYWCANQYQPSQLFLEYGTSLCTVQMLWATDTEEYSRRTRIFMYLVIINVLLSCYY